MSTGILRTSILDASPLYAPTVNLGADYAALSPTTTAPSGDGVLDLALSAGVSTNNVKLVFFGTDAANETAIARVTLWHKVDGAGVSNVPLYVPTHLIDVTCTLGAKTGVSGHTVSNSHLFVDTIVAATTQPDSVEILSPAGDLIASMTIDACGARFLQVQFKLGTGAAAGVLATPL